MTERLRFTMESDSLYSCIYDGGERLTCFELCDLLNEQQATITKLQIDLTDCKNRKEQVEYELQKKIKQLNNLTERIGFEEVE